MLFALAFVPGILQAGAKLSLADCVQIAVKNQPAIKAAAANIDAAAGREVQAASSYFPQLNGSTGYSEDHQAGGAFGDSIRKSYTTTLQLSQRIYDFGKTGNAVKAAEWDGRSLEQDRGRVLQEVILNVKQAYFGLLQAQKLVLIEQKRVEQAENHLKQAQAFFRAGSKPRFDVTRTEVELNNANLGLITAKNDVRIKTITLNNAMGIDPGQATAIDEAAVPAAENMPSLEQAEADALKNRAEMLKAEADIEAAKARVRAERANYLPTLSASGTYNWATGTSEGNFEGIIFKEDIGNSWDAGITLSVPFFEGMVTRGRVSEARANVIILETQRDTTRQSILLEVNQSYADMENARLRITVMESSRQKARENLDLAQGRYEAGVGPYIEVTDAQLASVQAETDYIQAQYDYQLSLARLLKATGAGEQVRATQQ